MAHSFGIVRILNSPHGKKYTSLKRALSYHQDGRAHYDPETNTLLFRDRAIVIAQRQREQDNKAGSWPWVQTESGPRERTGYGEGLGMQVMQLLTPRESSNV